MISRELKLRLRPAQERLLRRWLWHLTGVYNWTLRTIELDAANKIYHSEYALQARLNGHSHKLGIPSKVLRGTVWTAHNAWRRCFTGVGRRPRLKSRRNTLNSILFKGTPSIKASEATIYLPGLGHLRRHRQDVPAGSIKAVRLIRRASGWYANLTIDALPNAIPVLANGEVGIDPGFLSLLALSTGEKIEHPRELQRAAGRLAQAQRGNRKRLAARLSERTARQRRDRNHKLSRKLVSQHALIAWSADNHRSIAKNFGKSVASAALGELRRQLSYKCRSGGREFVEVPSRYSTRICSACSDRSGPTGYAGLSVRQWVCPTCGVEHDRDVNAAINTLIAGRGMRLERVGNGASGTAS